MPQLVKGGKWVFGWVTIGQAMQIRIPAQAYREYGFQAGEDIVFTHGSQRSGGFGLGRSAVFLEHVEMQKRVFAWGTMGGNLQVQLPGGLSVNPGDRLLAVRGSHLALGLIQRGPIIEEALRHSEIEVIAP